MKDIGELCNSVGRDALPAIINRAIAPIIPPPEPDDDLGEMVSWRCLKATEFVRPPEVIKGLLHQGSKMVIGGGSKSFKTWSLADLAMSVASGKDWWGMKTTPGKVLYVNLEIQPAFFKDRLESIAQEKLIEDDADENLLVMNLRGKAADFGILLPKIQRRIQGDRFSTIILDPIYKGLGDRDENSAGNMGSLMNEIEKLSVNTGAATVFGAHFSKGNQAGKESIDRISGSGVFARDPDTILVITKHENDLTYTVDVTLRNFRPMDPFCVRWIEPLMTRDDAADPNNLKRAGNKVEKFSPNLLLTVLGDDELTTGEWCKQVMDETNMKLRTFGLKKELLVTRKLIEKTPEGKWRKANH